MAAVGQSWWWWWCACCFHLDAAVGYYTFGEKPSPRCVLVLLCASCLAVPPTRGQGSRDRHSPSPCCDVAKKESQSCIRPPQGKEMQQAMTGCCGISKTPGLASAPCLRSRGKSFGRKMLEMFGQRAEKSVALAIIPYFKACLAIVCS